MAIGWSVCRLCEQWKPAGRARQGAVERGIVAGVELGIVGRCVRCRCVGCRRLGCRRGARGELALDLVELGHRRIQIVGELEFLLDRLLQARDCFLRFREPALVVVEVGRLQEEQLGRNSVHDRPQAGRAHRHRCALLVLLRRDVGVVGDLVGPARVGHVQLDRYNVVAIPLVSPHRHRQPEHGAHRLPFLDLAEVVANDLAQVAGHGRAPDDFLAVDGGHERLHIPHLVGQRVVNRILALVLLAVDLDLEWRLGVVALLLLDDGLRGCARSHQCPEPLVVDHHGARVLCVNGLLPRGLGGLDQCLFQGDLPRQPLDVAPGTAQRVVGPLDPAVVGAALAVQVLDDRIEPDAVQHQRVARSDRGDFSHVDGLVVLEVHFKLTVVVADAVHHPQLGGVQVPHLRVDRPLGHVGHDLDLEAGAVLLPQGVALADDAPLALLDVAGLPPHIDVVQADQALLHVHAGAHSLAGAEQEPHRPLVHGLEQGLFLGIAVVVLDEGNFRCRHALGHQQVCHVLVGVPPAGLGRAQFGDFILVEPLQRVDRCALALLVLLDLGHPELLPPGVVLLDQLVVALGLGHAAIQEEQLRSPVRRPLLVNPHGLVDRGIELAARLVGRRWLQHAGMQRHLAGPGHQAQPLLVALLHVLDGRQHVVAGDHRLQQRLLGGCGDHLHGAALAALDLGQRELFARVVLGEPALNVLVGDHVGHRVVGIHQGAHVRPVAAQPVHQFQAVAGLGGLQLLGGVHELRPEGVEVLQAVLGQDLRRQVAHDRVHLDRTVGDRRAGHEQARSAVLVQHPHLGVQVEGLLGPGRRAQAAHVGQLGRVGQVLELVGLVHRQVVHPHLLERQQRVLAGLAADDVQPLLQLVDQRLGCLDRQRLEPLARLGVCLRLLECLAGHSNLGVQVPLLRLGRDADELERGMGHDHHIPVARGDLGEQPAAVPGLQVLDPGGQDLGARVQPVGLGGPLGNQVVRHHDHGLARQAHAPALDRPRDAGERLAGAHSMVVHGEPVDHPAPDGVDLVAAELDDRVRHLAWELHV